jgi:hypothetical protein
MLNKFKRNVGTFLVLFLLMLSTFSIAGNFIVEVNAGGNSNSATASIKVIQNGIETETVIKGDLCRLDASDSEGDIVKYEWITINGGTWQSTNGQNYKLVTYHVFGEQTLSVRVTDSEGSTDTASITIRVINPNNKDPVANAGGGAYKRYFANTGYSVHFDGSRSYDPDPVVDNHGIWHSIVRYDWNFSGDSWHDDLGEVSSHTYNSPGEYTISLKVWDYYGAIDTDTATVYVTDGDPDTNKPPVPIIAEDFYYTSTGNTVTFDGSDSYDPDGGIIYHLWRVEDGDGWHESTSNHPPTTFSYKFKYESPPVSGWYVQLAVRDNDCVLEWTTARVFVSGNGGDGDGDGDGDDDEPCLEFSPKSHDFGIMERCETDSTTFQIWNGCDNTLTYTLSESCGWVTVSPSSGDSSGEHDTITVSIDTGSLTEGEYQCKINIGSNGGDDTYTVSVTIAGHTPPDSRPVEIIKPLNRNLYFKNNRVLRLFNTIVIGPITIQAEKNDNELIIKKVEFLINDEIKHTATSKPYNFLWNEKTFGRQSVKIKAYDNNGNVLEDEIKVLIINLGFGS